VYLIVRFVLSVSSRSVSVTSTFTFAFVLMPFIDHSNSSVPFNLYAYGKSKAAKRWLRMRAKSREILARRLSTVGRWVFPSRSNPGQHIGPAQRMHAAALKRSKVSCVPYDFRHTFATRAVEHGIDLPTLAAIMGHANLRSIMKYVHMDQGHMDTAMCKLDQTLPAVCPLTPGQNSDSGGAVEISVPPNDGFVMQ
jgi:Phage integrase family